MQSFIIEKIPVITNKILNPIYRIDLNQEAKPEGTRLKMKNHEVSKHCNHLACAGILFGSTTISLEVFYLSTTKGINTEQTSPCLARI